MNFKIIVESTITITGLLHNNKITSPKKGDKIIVYNYGYALVRVEIHRKKDQLDFAVKTEKDVINFYKVLADAIIINHVFYPNPNGTVTNIFTKDFLTSLIPWAKLIGHVHKNNNGHKATFIIGKVRLLPK